MADPAAFDLVTDMANARLSEEEEEEEEEEDLPSAHSADEYSSVDEEELLRVEQELEEAGQEPPQPPPQPQSPAQLQAGVPPTPVFDEDRRDLLDMTIIISLERCVAMLDEMWQKWYCATRNFDGEPFVFAYALFGFDPDTPLCNVEALRLKCTEYRELCLALYERLVKHGAIEADNPSDMLGKRLTLVLHVMNRAAECIVTRRDLADINEANFNAGMQQFKVRIGVDLAGDDAAVAALTSCQRLILTVLSKAFSLNLRKHQGYMFKQVMSSGEGVGGEVHRTHAWKEYMSVEEFVYSCADKHSNWERWKDLTSGRGNVDFAVDYINKSPCDVELRGLNPNRHVFSFTNGVYDALSDKMYAYDGDVGVPHDFVSAKYFDVPMPLGHEDLGGEDAPEFRDIPTPALDNILDHQGFSRVPWVPSKYQGLDVPYPGYSVVDWIYVFMGRMIYEIGTRDTWQALMFLKGKAGTGKSTLGKILSFLYNKVDVGVLSNNIEHKFGLSGLVDKLVYICYEVKKDFGLDQGELQSMISGEEIQVAAKNKDPRSVTWTSHGFFMGNEFPKWSNNSGSIGRRILTVLFDTVVTDGDPRLYDKLQAEMGNIIVKINRAYRECSAMYGGDDIWSVLPPYFKEQRERQLEAHTSALSAYLVYLKYDDKGQTYAFDPEGRTSVANFRTNFTEWSFINFGTKVSISPISDDWFALLSHGLSKEDNEIVGLRLGDAVPAGAGSGESEE